MLGLVGLYLVLASPAEFWKRIGPAGLGFPHALGIWGRGSLCSIGALRESNELCNTIKIKY